MGLDKPFPNIVVIKQWTPLLRTPQFALPSDNPLYETWPYPEYLVYRNFDPTTLLPSSSINGIHYDGIIIDDIVQHFIFFFSPNPLDTG